MIAKFKKISKKWSLLAVLVIAVIAAIALTNAISSSEGDTEINEDTPMGWGGYSEEYEASNPPQGYGGYGGNPDRENVLGYGGYSQGDNRPITRGRISRSRSQEGNSEKDQPVFYGASYEGSTPIGGISYGGYGYGAYRVKRPEAPNSPDDNSPENRP